jgi:hypothetical protein
MELELELSLGTKSISRGAQYVICTVQMDEENPKCAGLLRKMVLAQHNCARCRGW